VLWVCVVAALSIIFISSGSKDRERTGVSRLLALDDETRKTEEQGGHIRSRDRSFASIIELPYRLTPATLRARFFAPLEALCDTPGLTVPRLAGACFYTSAGMPLCFLLLTKFSTFGLAGAPVCVAFGLLIPRVIASRARNHYLEASRQALPDTADTLYAYILGGKNLDQAFRGAAQYAPEPLSPLLLRAVREIDLGASREEAFDKLAARCPVHELSSLLRSLLEAEKRGYSMSVSLAVFSREIRLRRRDQLRQKCAKAPLKMLAPLVFLILPASVLLTVGPIFLATLHRIF